MMTFSGILALVAAVLLWYEGVVYGDKVLLILGSIWGMMGLDDIRDGLDYDSLPVREESPRLQESEKEIEPEGQGR